MLICSFPIMLYRAIQVSSGHWDFTFWINIVASPTNSILYDLGRVNPHANNRLSTHKTTRKESSYQEQAIRLF